MEKLQKFAMPIAVLVAGVMVSGAVLYTGSGGSENPTTAQNPSPSPSEPQRELVPEVSAADHVRGADAEDAEVSLIEYADFQCPYCSQFHDTMQRVVAENDNVRWVSRHFAVFGTEPSVAAECVADLADEGAYHDFSDALYENQDQISREYFEELAVGYGIDEAEFSSCLDDSENRELVTGQSQNARDAGARGTPFSVLVDESTGEMYPISGALPYQQIVNRIEEITS